jgi:transposase
MQVLVATKPVDFRKQADGLAAIVQAGLGVDPFCGAIYVFRCKRMDRVKLLWWDGSGLCLMTKRLESGQFRWPPIEDGMMKLSAVQLATLLEGAEWSRVDRCEVIRPSAAQGSRDTTTQGHDRCCARGQNRQRSGSFSARPPGRRWM